MADVRAAILAAAATRKGMPYQIDPPPDGIRVIDCSLYVLKTLADAGVPLAGVRTAEQIRQATVLIDWADVKPGDLLFFENTYPTPGASHIGISLGAGTRQMWDANEAHGVGLTNIGTPYWQEHIFEARRIPALMNEGLPPTQPRGIDVSSHQGAIDWPSVAASGIAFAFIKVTEDDGYFNPRFDHDWPAARQAGIVRGAYHFARPEGGDADQEADYFLDQIDARGGLLQDDLLALDLESGSGDLGQWALDFLHHCEQRAGFRPFVYTGTWFSDSHGLGRYPSLAAYPLWQAAYSATMPRPAAPWQTITVWQHSDQGSVPGISGNVDLNVSTVPLDELRALGKSGSPPPPSIDLDSLIAQAEAVVAGLRAMKAAA